MTYNHLETEKKWQKYWEQHPELSEAKDFDTEKKKFYALVEFPYPSGAGLHVGHVEGYTALDIISRKKRMQGYNVLFPIGWDAFGLPTENYAIKTGIMPQEATKQNVKRFKQQMKSLGLSFDWSREINTTDPEYYKWTQWIFLKLLENDLAYKANIDINWCPSCKIGLANEEVIDGNCERCGAETTKRKKSQWLLKITKYADRLIDDLEKTDYLEEIKNQQINWIGRSEGAEIMFKGYRQGYAEKMPDVDMKQEEYSITVFTTRPDTIFGATYLVLSPEHPLVDEITAPDRLQEVKDYQNKAKKMSEIDRMNEQREKTGVYTGAAVFNPMTGQEIPVWIADYVLYEYGTGAIMAVPAHDERDFEFAKKFGLEIKQVIAPTEIDSAIEMMDKAYTDKGVLINSEEFNGLTSEDAGRKITSDLQAKKIGKPKVNYHLRDWVFSRQHYWGEPIPVVFCRQCAMKDIKIKNSINFYQDEIWEAILRGDKTIESRAMNPEEPDRYFGDVKPGDVVEFVNKNSEDKAYALIKKIIKYNNVKELFEDKPVLDRVWTGKSPKTLKQAEQTYDALAEGYLEKVNKNGIVCWEFELYEAEKTVPVPQDQLPIELPQVEKYQPTDTGESPLAEVDKWVNTICPVCGGPAKRETDTMPNWAGSSWYYLRYMDPSNDRAFADRKKLDYWKQVDLYNGGMEHVTLHLLYSRFWHKFLYDIKQVPTSEPYQKRVAHGMILAEDGRKMSKSLGNVINPDDVVKEYGADTLRIYEMFMGPYADAIPWDTKGIKGVRRFLDKVWNLAEHVKKNDSESQKDIESMLHKTIKKVTIDIDEMHFNTAVSQMMIFINQVIKNQLISQKQFEKFIIILSVFAPHMCEEIWHNLGHNQSIFVNSWPEFDRKLIIEDEIELPIQINGKVRDKIMIDNNMKEDQIKELALKSEKIKTYIENKEIKKVIYIKDRLLSIVV